MATRLGNLSHECRMHFLRAGGLARLILDTGCAHVRPVGALEGVANPAERDSDTDQGHDNHVDVTHAVGHVTSEGCMFSPQLPGPFRHLESARTFVQFLAPDRTEVTCSLIDSKFTFNEVYLHKWLFIAPRRPVASLTSVDTDHLARKSQRPRRSQSGYFTTHTTRVNTRGIRVLHLYVICGHPTEKQVSAQTSPPSVVQQNVQNRHPSPTNQSWKKFVDVIMWLQNSALCFSTFFFVYLLFCKCF